MWSFKGLLNDWLNPEVISCTLVVVLMCGVTVCCHRSVVTSIGQVHDTVIGGWLAASLLTCHRVFLQAHFSEISIGSPVLLTNTFSCRTIHTYIYMPIQLSISKYYKEALLSNCNNLLRFKNQNNFPCSLKTSKCIFKSSFSHMHKV
jgi:hypothetical protein